MYVIPPSRECGSCGMVPRRKPADDRSNCRWFVRCAGVAAVALACLLIASWWFLVRQPKGVSAPALLAEVPSASQVPQTEDAVPKDCVGVSTRRGLELRDPRLASKQHLLIAVDASRSELEPLQHFQQLRHLVIFSDATQKKPKIDLSTVGMCTGIRSLRLRELELDTLEPLSRLNGLKHLSLEWCTVHDWQSARDLAAPTGLSLDGSNIVELSCLSGLDRLDHLSLIFTRVRDLSPLRGHPTLRRLTLNKYRFSQEDVAALVESIPNLEITEWSPE